ncbi:divalent cation transporter [Oceaniserpentilla sp. 4NH20-0058]|uniref:ZIP family metal transporter n=1 Tax=Oceaniserpentilla sp. 4NH20-0058 TaxID=3127660 RepID=UPI0031036615
MFDLWTMLIFTAAAGFAMPLGALIARFEHAQKDWLENELRHSVMAFAAGALVSAIALVLVPQGIAHLNAYWACSMFVGGAFAFMLVDIYLAKQNTPASQLAAMLTDFIPESLALGAIFSMGSDHALLLALLIGLQNLPEGFNAYREILESGRSKAFNVIIMFALLALLGPICGLIGYEYLALLPHVLSAIMLFAAGGIMYSVFQDIAPNVKLEEHWFPPMGAVLGFVLGMLGHMLTS